MNTIKGNILTLAENGHFDVIIQGCNCFHTMGAGLAAQIALGYPRAKQADIENSQYGDWEKLGTYTHAEVEGKNGHRFTIINLYTQFSTGKPNGINENFSDRYHAIAHGIYRVVNDFPNSRIAIPLIGAGLAGGDWNIIKSIVEAVAPNVTVVEYQP